MVPRKEANKEAAAELQLGRRVSAKQQAHQGVEQQAHQQAHLQLKDPRKRPHLLTDQDLSGINSIDCLEEVQGFDGKKQHGPINCKSLNQTAAPVNGTKSSNPHEDGWYVGHFPKYTEKICHSNETIKGHTELFCDPDGILDKKDRKEVWKRLHKFWVENSVHSCPLPGADRPETFPFNLGVAIMQSFPGMELDEESLDHFGAQVMSSWDMMEHRTCPNGALLIFIKDYNMAFLSGLSCEFVCKKRPGGANVMSAMQSQMDQGNVFKAVMDGVDMFERVLQNVDPESVAAAKLKTQDDMNVSPELAEDIDSLEGELEELTGGKSADHEEGASKAANDEFSGKMTHEEWRRMKSLELYFARREGTYVLAFRFVVGVMLILTVLGCFCIVRHAVERDFHMAYASWHKDMDPTYNDPTISWDNYGRGGRTSYGSV